MTHRLKAVYNNRCSLLFVTNFLVVTRLVGVKRCGLARSDLLLEWGYVMRLAQLANSDLNRGEGIAYTTCKRMLWHIPLPRGFAQRAEAETTGAHALFHDWYANSRAFHVRKT